MNTKEIREAPIVKTHPLAEIIAKKLFGIEGVPSKGVKHMVARAIKAACKYHDNEVDRQAESIDAFVELVNTMEGEAIAYVKEVDRLREALESISTFSEVMDGHCTACTSVYQQAQAALKETT